jgi:predicted ATPase/DNA-binding SARP family transcriptional activator/class 3 adenylate cyclase/Tfp pilus assembly protein PilF
MAIHWRITLFGRLRAEGAGRAITRFRSQQTGALLAYLADHCHRAHHRDELIERFWPDADMHAGRRNLSTALSSLRQQIEPPETGTVPPAPCQEPGALFLVDRSFIQLNPRRITVDVAEFEAALRCAERAPTPAERQRYLTQAIEAYGGELLIGHYDTWILERRERLAEQWFAALGELLRCLEESGDRARAVEFARRGVAADRLREGAQRDLMRLLAGAGQPEAALRQYRDLERALKEELETTPEDATRALAREIERALAVPTAPVGVVLPPIRVAPEPQPVAPPPPEAPLPMGTVTFMFTAIDDAARLWEDAGDTYETALRDHHALLRRSFQQHGGREVKVTEAGFLVAFENATDALACAVAGQRAVAAHVWPERLGPLRLRTALHTAAVEPRAQEYWGPPLNRAARLLETASGGQVLLSLATAELVRHTLRDGLDLHDHGERRLRDLRRPERIFQLVIPGLPADFPPLRSMEVFRQNLPVQLTSFVGREQEIADVQSLLSTSRLLTLTGAGGCGKTRLALHVAARMLDRYPDGVWHVELAGVIDRKQIARAIAAVLGVQSVAQQPLPDTLAGHLGSRALLLLLDNCEHLLPDCGDLAEHLLRACPDLRILATSRQPLALAGETVYSVPPLSLPPERLPTRRGGRPDHAARGAPSTDRPEHGPRLTAHSSGARRQASGSEHDLMASEAVRLFVDRARAVERSFTLDEQNAEAVAHVCRRLDGLPLAIELAAARIVVLPVQQIAARLADRFRLLAGGSRTALPRHRTLRALIDWSYELLSPTEQRLLRRLSVFVGGFTLEGAEGTLGRVVTADGLLRSATGPRTAATPSATQPGAEASCESASAEMLDLLGRLVDHSLVAVGEHEGDTRYRLLETIHQYAEEKLRESGEEAVLRARHRDWCLELAEEADSRLRGPDQEQWLSRLEGEHDNLRAALGWCLETDCGEPMSLAEPGLRLASALCRFWQLRGHWTEGREWLSRLLALPGAAAPNALRAKALFGAGNLAREQGDFAAARALSSESLELQRALGDREGAGGALHALALIALKRGEFAEAHHLLCEALAIFRELEDERGIAVSLKNLGMVARQRGEYNAARELYTESLAIARRQGDKVQIGQSLNNLANVTYYQGEYESARLLFEESLAIWRDLDHRVGIAAALSNLGNLALDQGDFLAARSLQQESLQVRRELGDTWGVAMSLQALGLAATEEKQFDEARAFHEECLAIRRALGDRSGVAHSLHALGRSAQVQGEVEKARQLFEESLALFRELGDRQGIAAALHNLGQVARFLGDLSLARSFLEESLALQLELDARRGVVECLQALAASAAREQAMLAARLLGFTEGQWQSHRWCRRSVEQAEYEETAALLRKRLTPEAFSLAWEAGRSMRLEEAIEQARNL